MQRLNRPSEDSCPLMLPSLCHAFPTIKTPQPNALLNSYARCDNVPCKFSFPLLKKTFLLYIEKSPPCHDDAGVLETLFPCAGASVPTAFLLSTTQRKKRS